MNEKQDLEPRVKSLEDSLSGFIEGQSRRDEILFNKIDRLAGAVEAKINKVADDAKPDMTTWIGFAGIILTIIGMVCAPIGYFVVREWDKAETRGRDMDAKLQKEFALALETSKEAADKLEAVSKERHEQAMTEIEHSNERFAQLRGFVVDQTAEDLKELRARRLKDGQRIN